MNFSRVLTVIATLLPSAVTAMSEDLTSDQIFAACDKNHDGHLDDNELYVYQLHTGKAADYWKFDIDYNGIMSPAEIARFEASSKAAAKTAVAREAISRGNTERTPQRVTQRYPGKPPAVNLRKQLWGFQVVRQYDQLTLDPLVLDDVDKSNEAFQKADPAIFSFAHNYQAKQDTWQASGVVAKPIAFSSAFLIAPSLEFQRLDKSGSQSGAGEQDALKFRMQTQWDVENVPFLTHAGLVDNLELRTNALYLTNTGFDRGGIGGELDIEPSFPIYGNGRYFYGLPYMKLRWRAYLHGEFASNDGIQESPGTVAAVGPYLELDVAPLLRPDYLQSELNDRIHIKAKYAYFSSFTELNDIRFFQALAVIYLDSNHHFGLNIEYDNGIGYGQQNCIEQFLLSLGMKF